MTVCAIKLCRNYKGRVKNTKYITYHRFPNNPLRDLWIDRIRKSRDDATWTPTRTSVVCSDHFHSKDLYLPNGIGRRRLKKEAVPCKALFLSSIKSSDSEDSDAMEIDKKSNNEDPSSSKALPSDKLDATSSGSNLQDQGSLEEQPDQPDEEEESYIFFEPSTEDTSNVIVIKQERSELEESNSPTQTKRRRSDLEGETSLQNRHNNKEESRASSSQIKRNFSVDLETGANGSASLLSLRQTSKQDQARHSPVRIKRERSLDLGEARVCTSDANAELEKARAYIRQAVNVLNLALKPQEEDDCDLYGRLLAERLREMPHMERLEFMHEIDGLYLQRRGSVPLQSPRHVSRSSFNSGEEYNPAEQSPLQ